MHHQRELEPPPLRAFLKPLAPLEVEAGAFDHEVSTPLATSLVPYSPPGCVLASGH